MRIRITPSRALFAAIAALGLSSIVNAQSVATTPVGAVTTSVNPNSDQRIGVTLLRPAAFAGAVDAVAGATVSGLVSVPSFSGAHYILFKSGAAAGQWFQVASATTSSISVSEDLASAGVASGDTFEVRPFWTLSSLFPSGGGLPASADVFSPSGFVLLNDPQAVGTNIAASGVYFYHDGSQGPAGWYNNSDLSLADDVIVSPESSLILRNNSGASVGVLNVGDVPSAVIATSVVARAAGAQDNQVFNPYPSSFTLSASGLTTSGAVRGSADVFSPLDLVFVYANGNTGINSAPSATYFYHDGSQGPAGWYNNGDLSAADSVLIPAGAAITIRKGTGSSAVAEWAPPLPYTL